MTVEILLGAVLGSLVLTVVLVLVFKRKPRKLKTDKIAGDWKDLQAHCKNKETWPLAILEADKLLDAALKRRRFQGKSMGERMVAAQRTFSNNDAAWFAHNLCKKVLIDPDIKLKESDVKDALYGFRQALRDLGALPSEKEQAARSKE